MEEIRLKIAEFAREVGASPKTIYEQIKKERLITVNEVQNGRKKTLILTDRKQLEEFKKIYGNFTVNDGNCEDIVTVNDGEFTVTEFQNQQQQHFQENTVHELITLNSNLQEQLITVNERLITAESKQLLLEDKASREGMYLKEINELKTVNYRNTKTLITVIVISLLMIFGLAVMLVIKHFEPTKTVTETKIIKVDATGKPISVLTEKGN